MEGGLGLRPVFSSVHSRSHLNDVCLCLPLDLLSPKIYGSFRFPALPVTSALGTVLQYPPVGT